LKKGFKRGDPKKKAMMVTWEDIYSSSSENEEEHVVNLCLIEDLDKEGI